MYKLLDGKKLAEKIKNELKLDIINSTKKYGKQPGLAVIIVGNDEASKIYVNLKIKACKNLGIYSKEYKLPHFISENKLLGIINTLNNDSNIDGILVQSPLPSHINEKKVIESININKDVDGFHPTNVGKLLLGDESSFISCTPSGIIEILERNQIEISGKDVTIIGRSSIVGKPVAALFINRNATVTLCHSKSTNIKNKAKNADILVVAIGKKHFIDKTMIKKGAVVIDVGITRGDDNKLYGDVDFHNVKERASYITPVPGGVGPMTITMLMKNTYKSFINKMENI